MRWKYLLLSCLLAMPVGHALADTYDVFAVTGTYVNEPSLTTGSFSAGSTLTLDVTTGLFTSANIIAPPYGDFTFTTPIEQAPLGSFYFDNIYTTSGDFRLYLLLSSSVALLVANSGGTIEDTFTSSIWGGSCPSGGLAPCAYVTSGTVTLEPLATPLPAALPLFATGLGALGLLGWRRKRKNAVAFAAA